MTKHYLEFIIIIHYKLFIRFAGEREPELQTQSRQGSNESSKHVINQAAVKISI